MTLTQSFSRSLSGGWRWRRRRKDHSDLEDPPDPIKSTKLANPDWTVKRQKRQSRISLLGWKLSKHRQSELVSSEPSVEKSSLQAPSSPVSSNCTAVEDALPSGVLVIPPPLKLVQSSSMSSNMTLSNNLDDDLGSWGLPKHMEEEPLPVLNPSASHSPWRCQPVRSQGQETAHRLLVLVNAALIVKQYGRVLPRYAERATTANSKVSGRPSLTELVAQAKATSFLPEQTELADLCWICP